MTPHTRTLALVTELREFMLVIDDMLLLSPEEFLAHLRLCKSESFRIAIVLLNFLAVNDGGEVQP